MGRHYLLLTMILLVSGCAAKYTSPISSPAADQFSTTINRSFDETWQALVNHVSESFFKIDNFEKDSGLITLEFGASDLARYIDCGLWEHVNFNGPYVTYLEHNYGAKLKGRMNISTRIINAQKTEVRVNTRYVLSSEKASDLGSLTFWTFDSGSSATVNVKNFSTISPSRTCRPTYLAEGNILSALAELTK